MRHLGFAAATLCLLLAVPRTTRAGQIIYDIQNYPSDQNGHTVTGTITTDGHIGQLAKSDINSWSVTIDNTLTFRSTDARASTAILGDVQASPTAITLSATTPTATIVNELSLYGSIVSLSDFTALGWVRYPPPFTPAYSASSGTTFIWQTHNPTMGGTDPWVLAVA